MLTDDDLEKELNWSYENHRGDARVTAAAGIAVLRAINKFDCSSGRLARAMVWMTAALVVFTSVLVWLTYLLLRQTNG